jgi:predicted DNA-binding transcriptional regulator AlpA
MEVALSDSTTRAALLASAAHQPPTTAPTDRRTARRANRAEARALAADPLLIAAEAAAETGRALSTFWRDVKRGTLPAPYYVTPRAPRWRMSELRAAVEAAPRAPRAA